MACNNLQHTISLSKTTPVVGETVTCTSTVTNTGLTTEQFHIVVTANGAAPFYTSAVRTITPGEVITIQSSFVGETAGNVNLCADLVCDTVASTLVANFTATPQSGVTPLVVQ